MSGHLAIRRGSVRDLDALTRLEQIAFAADAFGRKQLRYLLTRANASVYVADEAGAVLGAAIMLWRQGATVGRLYSIATDPAARSRGLGSMLLHTCEAAAAQQDCRQVRLEVRVTNLPAVAFYERHGYRVVAELPGFYEDGTHAIRMYKDLTLSGPFPTSVKPRVPHEASRPSDGGMQAVPKAAAKPRPHRRQINPGRISVGAAQKPRDQADHDDIGEPGGQ
jgi:ribosomal protein S18 acetylase RimI-like enzyme